MAQAILPAELVASSCERARTGKIACATKKRREAPQVGQAITPVAQPALSSPRFSRRILPVRTPASAACGLAIALKPQTPHIHLGHTLRSPVWHRNIFCVFLVLPSPTSPVAQADSTLRRYSWHRQSCLWSKLHATAACRLSHHPKTTSAASIDTTSYGALCGIEIFSVCFCLCALRHYSWHRLAPPPHFSRRILPVQQAARSCGRARTGRIACATKKRAREVGAGPVPRALNFRGVVVRYRFLPAPTLPPAPPAAAAACAAWCATNSSYGPLKSSIL